MAICKQCGKEWFCSKEDTVSNYYLAEGEEPKPPCTICRCANCAPRKDKTKWIPLETEE